MKQLNNNKTQIKDKEMPRAVQIVHRNSGRPKVLYKYASLENPQYFFDTIVNSHLYAGLFSEMNDPMEGTFISSQELSQDVKDFFKNGKSMLRFCALSPSPYRTLMWSYYAKNHKGYCLEVEVDRFDEKALIKMHYDNNIPKDIEPNDESIKRLLCRKFTDWAHEEEWRLFVNDGSKYINDVRIKTIYFGVKIEDKDFELYKGVINKICPNIKVEKMKKTKLLMPENHIDTSNKFEL